MGLYKRFVSQTRKPEGMLGSMISSALMERIHRDYRGIIAFNSLLIALGAGRVITSQTSAMLHNMSTLAISMRTVEAADKIIVLDQGHVAEQGSPQQLLEKESSIFRHMTQLQAQGASYRI